MLYQSSRMTEFLSISQECPSVNNCALNCCTGYFTIFMQYSAVQCSAVQCSAAQCSAVQYPAVQCSTVQYRAVQCSAVRFLTLQYSSVLCKFRDQLNRDGHRQDSGGNVTFSIELVLPPQLTPAANVLPMHLHMWAVST